MSIAITGLARILCRDMRASIKSRGKLPIYTTHTPSHSRYTHMTKFGGLLKLSFPFSHTHPLIPSPTCCLCNYLYSHYLSYLSRFQFDSSLV